MLNAGFFAQPIMACLSGEAWTAKENIAQAYAKCDKCDELIAKAELGNWRIDSDAIRNRLLKL